MLLGLSKFDKLPVLILINIKTETFFLYILITLIENFFAINNKCFLKTKSFSYFLKLNLLEIVG